MKSIHRELNVEVKLWFWGTAAFSMAVSELNDNLTEILEIIQTRLIFNFDNYL